MATTTLFTYAGDADGGGQLNRTLRQYIPSSLLGGSGNGKVRFRFYAASGEALNIQKARVGLSNAGSGDNYDYQETPTNVTFGGSPNTTVTAGSNTWSDWVNFKIPASTDILVTIYVANNASQDGLRAQSGATGAETYSKAGDDVDTVNASGYSSLTSAYMRFVLGGELQQASGQVMIFVSS